MDAEKAKQKPICWRVELDPPPQRNNTYIAVHTNKNLGTCIIDRTLYIHKGCLEHLSNENNYK